MRNKPLTNKWHEHSHGHYYIITQTPLVLIIKKIESKKFYASVQISDVVICVYNGQLLHFRTLKSAKAACEQEAINFAKKIIDNINEPERELVLE